MHALLRTGLAGIGALLQPRLQTCVDFSGMWHAIASICIAMCRSAWPGCAGGACGKAGRYGGARCGAGARAAGEEGPQGPLCGSAQLGRQFYVLGVRACPTILPAVFWSLHGHASAQSPYILIILQGVRQAETAIVCFMVQSYRLSMHFTAQYHFL